MKTYRIAVTGGRDYKIPHSEAEDLKAILCEYNNKGRRSAVLIHGNCRGVDQQAAELAESWGYPVVPFEAPWEWSGPAAGPLRNRMMLKAADLLVAFPGGKGTANCIRQARELGVEVVEVKP